MVNELSTLNVQMVIVPLNVPSFPSSHKTLVVYGGSIIGCSDVSVLGQGLESPCPVNLLFSCEQLVVVGGWGDLESELVGPGSQVVSANLESDVLETFALVAVVKIILEVEDVFGRRVEVDGDRCDDLAVVELADSCLVFKDFLGSSCPNNPESEVSWWIFRGCGFIAWPLDGLGEDRSQKQDNCKEQKVFGHMSYNYTFELVIIWIYTILDD